MIVQLIHPPHPSATDDKLDAPLGLLYVAQMIKRAGHDVSVVDLCGTGMDESKWREVIGGADLYGLTSYVCTMDVSARIAQICKEKNPESKIIAGGANVTGFHDMLWEDELPVEYNSLVIGDGEIAILQAILDFPNLKPYYEFPLERDLDVYPNPDYDMVDIKSYHRTIDDEQSISILTSRGCPFRCAFCGLPKQKRTVRYRSPEAVYREIKFLKERYGFKAFNFQDDTFIVNKERVWKLMELLEPLDITFRCLGRAGLDTKEDYRRLKDAGCSSVAWGIESGSQMILDRMNKKVTVEQNREVIRWAHEVNLVDRVFILVGFPGETAETLEETKQFIDETDPSQYLASTFQPYPGIDVVRYPAKYGIKRIYRDYEKYIQIKADGNGGDSNIDTIWHTAEEMSRMITDFKTWINIRKRRGPMQGYEKDLEKMKSSPL